MKAYPLDLRQKILQAYDHGRGSQHALAALFGVSRGFVEPLLPRRRTTGAIAPRPHVGGRPPCCDRSALALVRHLVQAPPDATLAELCTQLQQQRGIRVSVATMCRLSQRLGLPRKKSPSMPPNARRHASNTPVRATGSGWPRALPGA
jgi:transposase